MFSSLQTISIFVSDLDEATQFWRDCLGLTFVSKSTLPQEITMKLKFVRLQLGSAIIELVADTGGQTVVIDDGTNARKPLRHFQLTVTNLAAIRENLKTKFKTEKFETSESAADKTSAVLQHPRITGNMTIKLIQTTIP